VIGGTKLGREGRSKRSWLWRGGAVTVLLGASLTVDSCGARTSLLVSDSLDTPDVSSAPDASDAPDAHMSQACQPGDSEACGSNVGACKKGISYCVDGFFGPCLGGVQPSPEACNGIDDDCDGQVDEDFGVGQACDGPDTDLCADDTMTCNGCSTGANNVEICNGIDDDCNGIIDADCVAGDCKPSLYVAGSMSSSPSCIDFPIEAMATGSIEYPCGGGAVTAELGGILFNGSVTNDYVSLDGTQLIGPMESPDHCSWQMGHLIQGSLSSGALTYSYSETLLSGVNCWSPCTETGSVQIQWVAQK
jgi:hypothetical protein